MPSVKIEQEGSIVKKADTWIIIIQKPNHSKLKPFVGRKNLLIEIGLKTQD